jgi:hypothetical protein
VRAFAVAIHESHREVSRFFAGTVSKKVHARLRPKIEAWLAPKLAHTSFTPEVIASLDDGELCDLLFWSRYVARPSGLVRKP